MNDDELKYTELKLGWPPMSNKQANDQSTEYYVKSKPCPQGLAVCSCCYSSGILCDFEAMKIAVGKIKSWQRCGKSQISAETFFFISCARASSVTQCLGSNAGWESLGWLSAWKWNPWQERQRICWCQCEKSRQYGLCQVVWQQICSPALVWLCNGAWKQS